MESGGSESLSTRLGIAATATAIAKLRLRIADLARFDPERVESRGDDIVHALVDGIEHTLVEIFGAGSLEYARFSAAKNIDTAPFLLNGTPIALVRHGLEQGKAMAVALLEQAVAELETGTNGSAASAQPAAAAVIEPAAPAAPPSPQPAAEPVRPPTPPPVAREPAPAPPAAESTKAANADVLLLCEEGEAVTDKIVRFLTKANLTPVVVTVRAGAEPYTSAGFAIALLRAEEEGGPRGGPHRPRARQGAIARLYYSAGRLGPGKVCALVKDEFELPLELGGIACVPLDPYEGWQKGLLRALEGAGYKIDWAAALR